MIHYASPAFWSMYKALPNYVKKVADKNYEILKLNPNHPSLHFKKIGRYWSVRIGIHYRALAVSVKDGLLWFWIGSHADYNQIIDS